MNAMIITRFVILWFVMYFVTNMFGFSFINPHDGFGSSLTGMSRWIYNEILGTIVAWLFAILWGMKAASDIHYSQEDKK